jgi:hypothetical protein
LRCDCSYNFDRAELEDKTKKVDRGAWKRSLFAYVVLALGTILGTAVAVVLKDKVDNWMSIERKAK